MHHYKATLPCRTVLRMTAVMVLIQLAVTARTPTVPSLRPSLDT